jgi:hypothetical protein
VERIREKQMTDYHIVQHYLTTHLADSVADWTMKEPETILSESGYKGGACPDGPLQVELDGAVRRLCGFSDMNLPEVPAEHYETIQFLVKAQDGILKKT